MLIKEITYSFKPASFELVYNEGSNLVRRILEPIKAAHKEEEFMDFLFNVLCEGLDGKYTMNGIKTLIMYNEEQIYNAIGIKEELI